MLVPVCQLAAFCETSIPFATIRRPWKLEMCIVVVTAFQCRDDLSCRLVLAFCFILKRAVFSKHKLALRFQCGLLSVCLCWSMGVCFSCIAQGGV